MIPRTVGPILFALYDLPILHHRLYPPEGHSVTKVKNKFNPPGLTAGGA